eukprot:15253149-Heterocapsa_arctica.AAC.1
MLDILLRRIDFVLQERAAAANAAAPDVPVAPRAATPAFPSAGAGPVPAHWGQAARTLPNVDLRAPYASDTP